MESPEPGYIVVSFIVLVPNPIPAPSSSSSSCLPLTLAIPMASAVTYRGQGRKVKSVEEISSLNEKFDLIMSLLTKKSPIDPQNVPLNSLIAQDQVDVNFISRNNFNNNAYRSNFGSNPRPFPSNNYGNNN